MRYRLTITAALAVLAASFSLFTLISGAGWLYASIGAVIVAAAAGLATRVTGIPAAATAAGLMLIAVMPLLAGSTWLERIGGVALVAAMAGSAATRRVLPALASAGTYLAALFLYLNLAFARDQSWAWIIPTAKSVRHLGRLVTAGYGEHIYAPPVPGVRGLELITAAGVGLIAVATDLIAVRLRSPAVAGLPLLVLFSVPVATNVKDVGLGLTVAFCLGITGYLALLTADGRERLRLWGRLVTVWQETPEDEDARGPDTRALAASGRRIGLAAVALAVIVPLALPGVKEHGLFGTNPAPGSGSAKGGIKVTAPQPLVVMRNQLLAHASVPVLTYRTNAASPAQQYLQMYVMNYDGKSAWTLPGRGPSVSVAGQSLPSAPGLAPDTDFDQTRTTITIGKNSSGSAVSYLPAPYAPEVVTVPGAGWQETTSTLMLYGYKPDAGLRYSVVSKTAQPTQAERQAGGRIPASVKRTYLSYPGPNRARLARIAAQITAGAHTSFSRALALQQYFTQPGRFTYALRGNLPLTVLQFLTTDRRGFCQQFAFSMAVLARLLGIPSRVAVGYTAGSLQRNHTWQVTTSDAHAWPELYFPRTGWLRFEPTPSGPGGQGTATPPAYSAAGTAGTGSTNLGGSLTAPPVVKGNGTGQNGAGGINKPIGVPGLDDPAHSAAAGGGFPVGLVVLLVIAVLLIAPGLGRVLTRRRRWLGASDDPGRAHAAWRELTSDLADLGLGGAASESPRALARRVAASADLDQPAREALDRIAAAEERARYARTPADGESLQSDGRLVRRAVARHVTGRQRWRARLLPASTVNPVGAWLREAADVFGWMDAAGMRIRRTVGGPGRPRRAG
jgi:transglutaminase-like putative cysteine protease